MDIRDKHVLGNVVMSFPWWFSKNVAAIWERSDFLAPHSGKHVHSLVPSFCSFWSWAFGLGPTVSWASAMRDCEQALQHALPLKKPPSAAQPPAAGSFGVPG
jgi:hypothetical protein